MTPTFFNAASAPETARRLRRRLNTEAVAVA
jgi:hypothetical protein